MTCEATCRRAGYCPTSSSLNTDLPHLWFFSEPGLVGVCEAAGLEVVRSATLGIRRRQVKATLPVRTHRRLMRVLRGAWWSEPGRYSEGRDRTDLLVLCRAPGPGAAGS